MTTPARYGRSRIDIKVTQSRQLFDFRDPAPFRERDLDDEAVEYLLASAREFIGSFPPGPVREILREGVVITGVGRHVAAA